MDIEATIIQEKDSHKGIIDGKGGAMPKKRRSGPWYEMETMLEMKVNLQVWVKVKRTGGTVIFWRKILGMTGKKYNEGAAC